MTCVCDTKNLTGVKECYEHSEIKYVKQLCLLCFFRSFEIRSGYIQNRFKK